MDYGAGVWGFTQASNHMPPKTAGVLWLKDAVIVLVETITCSPAMWEGSGNYKV